jgi:hypothetical protein
MSEQTTLRVYDIVGGELCIASDDGQKVYEQIVAALQEGKSVELSFDGVVDLTSSFLNTAIGQLYNGDFDENTLRTKLSVADDTKPEDVFLLMRVVDRAKNFFNNPGEVTRIVRREMDLVDAE